jgi:hypothetical protein
METSRLINPPAQALIRVIFWLTICARLSSLLVFGAEYYVDATSGDDGNSGKTPEMAWRSLEKVNLAEFKPGDRIRFRAGSTWAGHLVVTARGEAAHPIVFEAYGPGARPTIATSGEFEEALLLRNVQHVEVRGLEVTNMGTNNAPRRGVHILADNAGSLRNTLVTDLFVHNVNGTQRIKDNGGIVFTTRGERTPTRFDGLRIERNIVWRVDRSGIVAQSYHASRTRWFPSTNVVIRDNWIGDVGGDGITPWATDGCLVEHNILQGANERAGTYNAGIWPWSTDNTVIRLNRASGVKTLLDGQGFDSDFNSRNTLLEFNLSHDNEGGFLLICTPGQRKRNENCGNVGTIARYNISRHDAARTFHVSAAEQTLVCNNAVYIAPNADVQVLLLSDWSGWANGLELRDNLFSSEGVARYGHQVTRSKDGSYGIAPGWGPATNIVFRGNRYVGRHENQPQETNGTTFAAPNPIRFDDWPGPQFDPQHPEGFGTFIQAHREWMLKLMERQFGRRP